MKFQLSQALAACCGTLVSASSVYVTAAWGMQEQPDFLNAVVVADTSLAPSELLALAERVGETCLAHAARDVFVADSKEKQDTRVKTSMLDDLTADWFEISTKDGDDAWSGKGVTGDVYPDDDEIPREKKDKKPEPKPTAAPAPANPSKPPRQSI